jgi:CRP-like cAMP-binding protein
VAAENRTDESTDTNIRSQLQDKTVDLDSPSGRGNAGNRPKCKMRHFTRNHILASLPRTEYDRLASALQVEQLPVGRVLHEPGEPVSHVLFLNGGVVSLISGVDNRFVLEVGMIGNEGMVGLSAILGLNRMPQRAIVQIAGHAVKLKLSIVRNEFKKGGKLQSLLLRSMHLLHFQVVRSAVCNRFHPTEARLCRWLLMCRDRIDSNEVPLTQECLSQMLGAARPMVSFAADLKC